MALLRERSRAKLKGPLPCVCFGLYGRQGTEIIEMPNCLLQAIKSLFLLIFLGWGKIYSSYEHDNLCRLVDYLVRREIAT